MKRPDEDRSKHPSYSDVDVVLHMEDGSAVKGRLLVQNEPGPKSHTLAERLRETIAEREQLREQREAIDKELDDDQEA